MKKILIVDHLSPSDRPNIEKLQSLLVEMGYDITVFTASDTLEKSRESLEAICESNHFDAIVAMDIGCQLAARITNATRIFVNPDWTACDGINYSDEMTFGWFSTDKIDSDIAKEHSRLFNSNTYIPDLGLDTDKGIATLAKQIDIYLSIADE